MRKTWTTLELPAGNPALTLYQRLGFQVVPANHGPSWQELGVIRQDDHERLHPRSSKWGRRALVRPMDE
jgi:hypothetical protein